MPFFCKSPISNGVILTIAYDLIAYYTHFVECRNQVFVS